jgi:hypothetical protein
MARDVAQRELDQAGFRISKLGDPTQAGDATKTDNTSLPKPASGEGAPGSSFLAAPADHVHPAAPGTGGSGGELIAIDDPSQQAASGGPFVIWQAAVNFGELPGDKVLCSVGAVVRAVGGAGKVELKIGGDPNRSDGALAVAFETTSGGDEVKGGRAEIAKPSGLEIVKLLAGTVSNEAQVFVKAKSIVFKAVP